jgi:signal peptidase I
MIRTAFLRSFDWSGRAPRREVWGFAAFVVVFVVATAALEIWLSGASPQSPRWVFLAMAVFAVPLISLLVRRLHDMARSGGWLSLACVPYVGLLVLVWLLFAPTNSRKEASESAPLPHLFGAAFVGLSVVLIASRAFWAPYWIASGSMKPGLLTGDYVAAQFIHPDDAQRGDVIVMRHPVAAQDSIARLIGLPGDRVQLQDGVLMINAIAVLQAKATPFVEVNAPHGPSHNLPRCGNAPVGAGGQCITDRVTESLADGRSYDTLDIAKGSFGDATRLFTVPPGSYFVLGDNRDDSQDSRYAQSTGGLGMVPEANLIARVDRILFSAAGSSPAAFWSWRSDRVLRVVQ